MVCVVYYCNFPGDFQHDVISRPCYVLFPKVYTYIDIYILLYLFMKSVKYPQTSTHVMPADINEP